MLDPVHQRGFTMDEVAKHTKIGQVRVVVHGRFLNVANILSQDPGGELAKLTFAGKDDSGGGWLHHGGGREVEVRHDRSQLRAHPCNTRM